MPRVSVLVPAYLAGQTYQQSLKSLRAQRYHDFELIVVETGPQCGLAGWLDQYWPEAIYLHELEPKLPHVALNLALQRSRAELCAFTDIDAYPEPQWLAALVSAYDCWQQPIAGGVKCYGKRLIDRGAHLVKFDKWLTGLQPRLLQEAPTVNFLVPRRLLVQAGGFRPDSIHADTDMSWRLRQQGNPIHFAPESVVEHHHLHTWWSLLRERYHRGLSFAEFMLDGPTHGLARPWLRALVGILPLRLVSQTLRVTRHAVAAGYWFDLVAAFPIVASGLYAWLLGESLGYLRRPGAHD